jgi:tetratricopeptide (TPR) repeat protein
MQHVIEQATQALQLRRFEAAKTLVSAVLEETKCPTTRLALLEILAQAQTGLQEHAAAVHSWQDAYEHAAAPDDKGRVFEQARQAIRDQQDYAALLHLAQEHLPHIRTPQEHAACLLAAGEALIHLQRYQEARQEYLEPALELAGATPETRLHLWHYLGLSHLAEHRFTDAAAAFRQSADLALGQHFASTAAHLASQRAQLHHVRNAARFYEGVIHLIYQRPQQAVQSFQELQRPLTAVGAFNVALFLGMGYRALQQPEAAIRALQGLARTATCPETLRGPAAVVRAGIANIHESPASIGEHLEAALEAALQPRTSWEPSWHALLYREFGIVLRCLSCREAAIACYEDGLKAVVQRIGVWDDMPRHDGLQGASLLAALTDLPVHTWSAVAQGEMIQFLQGLAWLYAQTEAGALTEMALALALRLATTPEQEVVLWCQRAWFVAMGPPAVSQNAAVSAPVLTIIEELQTVQARCEDASLEPVVRGITALLQGQVAQASAALVHVPAVPAFPELQALCTAAWLWAHTQQGTLEQALGQGASTASLPWHMPRTLAFALEILLAWTTHTAPLSPAMPWLAALLVYQPAPTLEVLRILSSPGYLPASQYTGLLAELKRLSGQLADAAIVDQVAVLLGSTTLMERLETLLAELDQRLAMPTVSAPPAARQRKQRQRRGPTPTEGVTVETAQVLQLIGLLHTTAQAVESRVPEIIYRWLRHYSHLCTHAPEIVGALLGLLRQCPGATTVIPALLEHVALSRRQRQALEAALHTPAESTTVAHPLAAWEDLLRWPLGRLLDTLSALQRPAGTEHVAALAAQSQYIVALVLARVGLLPRAMASLQACLQLQPEHPLAHYTLAQFLRTQDQQEAALDHTLQAWHGLMALGVPTQVLHLEMLNQLLILLETTYQYERFPEWLAAFDRASTALRATPLSPAQQQRVREEEGTLALSRASYLAATALPIGGGMAATTAQQLACVEQAIALGAPHTQQRALHRQAEMFTRLYRYGAAATTYHDLVQQWPDDQRARQRLELLTIIQHSSPDPVAADRIVQEALTASYSSVSEPAMPAPLTPDSALAWLQQAPRHGPQVLDVLDILTAYGGMAIQRQEWQRAIEVLTPLYTLGAQPQQAYYLALAHYARSQQTAPGREALHESEQALQYAQEVLKDAPSLLEVTALLRQMEEHHQGLLIVRSQEQDRLAYRQRVHSLFAQHDVPVQEHTVARAAGAPWVEMQELADLDEATGKLVTIVHLWFNGQAVEARMVPDEAEITLYAQHQRDKQRLVETHGIEALPWPHTVYEGSTDFAALFPERLGLNRDVLFIAFADVHALIRYARVLQYIAQGFPTSAAAIPTPSISSLAAMARYLTVVPLLHQRLQILAAAAPSKVVQRQISSVCETLTTGLTPEPLQHFPAFVDAYVYFHAIVDTLRAHLDTPATERPSVQSEERQTPRPARRKRRQNKDRWREGEPERRREGYFSDVL